MVCDLPSWSFLANLTLFRMDLDFLLMPEEGIFLPASTNFVVNLGSRIVNLESGDSFATFFVVPDFS